MTSVFFHRIWLLHLCLFCKHQSWLGENTWTCTLLHLSSFRTGHVEYGVFLAISGGGILKEIVSNSRNRQNGLQYACESYILNIICGQTIVNEENMKNGRKTSPDPMQASGTACPDNSCEGRTCSGKTMFLYSRVSQYIIKFWANIE